MWIYLEYQLDPPHGSLIPKEKHVECKTKKAKIFHFSTKSFKIPHRAVLALDQCFPRMLVTGVRELWAMEYFSLTRWFEYISAIETTFLSVSHNLSSSWADVFPEICNDSLRSSAAANGTDLYQLYPEIANQTDKSIVAKFLIVCQGDEIFVNLTNTIFLVGHFCIYHAFAISVALWAAHAAVCWESKEYCYILFPCMALTIFNNLHASGSTRFF